MFKQYTSRHSGFIYLLKIIIKVSFPHFRTQIQQSNSTPFHGTSTNGDGDVGKVFSLVFHTSPGFTDSRPGPVEIAPGTSMAAHGAVKLENNNSLSSFRSGTRASIL